jgi:hypothetical protein
MTNALRPWECEQRPFLNHAHGTGIHGAATMTDALKAPFPYFGGKSKVAPLVWQRLGDCDNVVEAFCGSAAFLLARPHPPRVETLNDADHMVANFWRATQQAPEAVALYADGPVNETDLHSRHRFLVLSDEAKEFRQRMKTDPFYFDPMVAGWWCWGLCAWIGGGWCQQTPGDRGRNVNGEMDQTIPLIGAARRTVNNSVAPEAGTNADSIKGVHARGDGLRQKRPQLDGSATGGMSNGGVDAAIPDSHRPQLADAYARGRGVHGNDAADHYLADGKRPRIDGRGEPGKERGSATIAVAPGVLGNPADGGTCASRRAWLVDWFCRLRDRLRTVRVCSGDFMRVMDSESVTTRLGLTGIFCDPPYPSHRADGTESRSDSLYATDGDKDALIDIRDRLLAYCLARGQNPKIRICVAYYEGDGYEVLKKHGWKEIAWRASGGYGNRSAKGKKNAKRERLIFSPHCLRGPASLFDSLDALPGLFQQGEQQCENETS